MLLSPTQSSMTMLYRHFRSKQENGFTLLEVIVSLTIIGFALGSLFSALAGNKKLAMRSLTTTNESISIRYLLNYQQLPSKTDKHIIDKTPPDRVATALPLIEPPARKSQRIHFQLSPFEIEGEKLLIRSTYWHEHDHAI